MLTAGRVAEEVYVIADAVSGIAVVAGAVYVAGRVLVGEPHIVQRTGSAACPLQRGVGVLAYLVHADYEDDVTWAEGDGGHTVAVAVDVDDDAVLADGVGAAEIVVCRERLQIDGGSLLGRGGEVTVEQPILSAPVQGLDQSHVADGHGASPADGAARGHQLNHFLDGLSGRGAIVCAEMAAGKALQQLARQLLVSLFCYCHKFKFVRQQSLAIATI